MVLYRPARTLTAFCLILIAIWWGQWSSKGRPVHLIDAQQKQLSHGVEYIQELRAASKTPDQKWGEVKTFTSDNLAAALEGVWLVVEV